MEDLKQKLMSQLETARKEVAEASRQISYFQGALNHAHGLRLKFAGVVETLENILREPDAESTKQPESQSQGAL